jgi:hypothetical protein
VVVLVRGIGVVAAAPVPPERIEELGGAGDWED